MRWKGSWDATLDYAGGDTQGLESGTPGRRGGKGGDGEGGILARIRDARFSSHDLGSVEVGPEALAYGKGFLLEVLVSAVAMMQQRRSRGGMKGGRAGIHLRR